MVIIRKKSVGRELLELGYTSDLSHHVPASRPGIYILQSLFEEWAQQGFFSNANKTQGELNCSGEAHLALDGSPPHTSDAPFDDSISHRIVPCFLPSHSGQHTHSLDLGLLGIEKRDQTEVAQAQQIVKIRAGMQRPQLHHR
jgi:hypothetical protein